MTTYIDFYNYTGVKVNINIFLGKEDFPVKADFYRSVGVEKSTTFEIDNKMFFNYGGNYLLEVHNERGAPYAVRARFGDSMDPTDDYTIRDYHMKFVLVVNPDGQAVVPFSEDACQYIATCENNRLVFHNYMRPEIYQDIVDGDFDCDMFCIRCESFGLRRANITGRDPIPCVKSSWMSWTIFGIFVIGLIILIVVFFVLAIRIMSMILRR